jgi:hypothetical protein
LDNLVNLAVEGHGLALGPDGRLADAEARRLAESLAITGPPGPGAGDLDAVQLLRALAEAIGLLRARGDRLQATTRLCHQSRAALCSSCCPRDRAAIARCRRGSWGRLLGPGGRMMPGKTSITCSAASWSAGEVVLAAQPVVVDPRRASHAGIDLRWHLPTGGRGGESLRR